MAVWRELYIPVYRLYRFQSIIWRCHVDGNDNVKSFQGVTHEHPKATAGLPLPESRRRIEEMAEEMLFETHLHQLREALNISQQELAKTLGISQPSVAAIEGRGNELKISTLKRYVEAMGGTLRLDIELPGGKHVGFTV